MKRTRGAAMLLVTVLAVAAASDTAPARACPGVSVEGSWKTIETPLRAAAFTVAGDDRIFVGGGPTIAASDDGGCTWREVLRIEAVVPEPVGEHVTSLATVGETIVAAVTGPYVAVSADGGATWTPSSSGLDVPGEPIGLYPAGDVVYLLVRQEVTDEALAAAGVSGPGASAIATVVYRSANRGVTWTRGDSLATAYTGPHGTGVEGGSAPGAAWDLAVDPGDPDHLLAASRGGVFRSLDGGRTWEQTLSEPGSQVRAVAIWRRPGGPAAAVAVDPLSGAVYETASVGGEWRRRVHPQLRTEMMAGFPNAAAWSWAAAGSNGDVVLSGPKGVFRPAGAALLDVTPPGLAAPGGTAADLRVFGDASWARTLDGSALLAEVTPASGRAGGGDARSRDGSAAKSTAEGLPGLPDPPVRGGRAELTPQEARVELAVGESRAVPFEARLTPRTARVDLYFVVDTTASMSPTIRGLVGGMEDIVLRLARSGIRLRAGVGAFRSYPRESDSLAVDYPYRRMRGLGPVDAELLRALYELEGAGSSGANLTALYQAVTGTGQDVLPPGPSKADVRPGGEAGFRDGSLKVVMHLADSWFGTPDRGDPSGRYAPGTWPGPSMGAAAEALRAEGVLHLGIALQPGAGGNGFADADVVEDMRTLSRATSSSAGERGADCDGDGRPDLSAGEPLVCLLDRDADAGGVASVVTGLVEALERRDDVRLAEIGESGVLRAIAPPLHAGVDLRAPQKLRFDVTVGCDLDDAGTSRTVDLGLLVAGKRAARSALEVACAEPAPSPLPPNPLDPRATPLALIPPIPVPPPPHPVPGPGPGSVTAPAPVQAPAPAQVPGGQPHAATVAQRQQQPQVAFVTAVQQVRAQTQMQHAMVRTSTRDPLAEARLWTAVGALSLVWMWGLARAVVSPRTVRARR